jgi:hypothetical protein
MNSQPPLISFRVGAILLLVAVLWGWFDVRKRARTSDTDPAVHKTDITVYTEAGAAMFDGRDPYLVSNPRGWHYLYPPLFAIVMAPLSLLPTTEQALIWYALSCLCLVGIVVELRRLWRWQVEQRLAENQTATTDIPAWLGWTVVAGLALPTLNCLQRGQVGVCIVYFLLLGARLVLCSTTKRGILLGGLVLALPVTIKLTPLLPAAMLAGGLLVQDLVRWARARRTKQQAPSINKLPLSPSLALVLSEAITQRKKADQANTSPVISPSHESYRGVWSCVGGIAGLLLWFLLVPAVTIGSAANTAHLRTWMNRVVANDNVGAANDFNFKSKRNQSLDNGVRRLGNLLAYASGNGPDDQLVDRPDMPQTAMPMETATVDRGIKLAVLGFLLGLAALVLRTAWQSSLTLWPAVFGLGCLATTIVSPLSWGHHYVMAAPAMLFVPALLLQPGKQRAAMILAGSAAALCMSHYVALEVAGRIGLLGIGMSVWTVAAIVVTFAQVQRHALPVQMPELATKDAERRSSKRAA